MSTGQSGERGGSPLRVVWDSNVIVSGLNFGGIPGRVLDTGENPRIAVYISPYILGEVERVLMSPKLGWSRDRLDISIRTLRGWVNVVDPARQVTGVSRDVNDDPILACCLECDADYLVTGDRDLLVLGEFRGTGIVDAGAFLRIYEELAGGGS